MSSTPTQIPPVGYASTPAAPAEAWPQSSGHRRHAGSARWLRLGTWLAVAGVLAVGGYLGLRYLVTPASTNTVQTFTVVPRTFPVLLQEKGELDAANSIDIRSEVEGKATIIFLVEEGAHVKEGDLLVELASDVIDENIRDADIKVTTAVAAYEAAAKEAEILEDQNASEIRQAQLALELAELALEKYSEGEVKELRQDAELALQKAKSVVQRTKDNFEDSQALFKDGFITRIDLENDRFSAYEAEIEEKKATLALDVLETYTVPMAMREKTSDKEEALKELARVKKSAAASEAKAAADVAAKHSELKLMQEKLAKLRDQKSKTRITAPAAGLVVYARDRGWGRSDTQIEKGATVIERQSLIKLPDTSSMKVVLRVHEAKTPMLKVGLPASVEVEGLTGKRYRGKITKIAVLADSRNRWLNPNLKEYETEVVLDGAHPELKPGTTARAEIQVARLSDVLAVPVQAVYAKAGRYYVFVDSDGEVVPREIKVGMSSTEYAEVVTGLSGGELVRLAVPEQSESLLPSGTEPRKRRSQEGESPAPPANAAPAQGG